MKIALSTIPVSPAVVVCEEIVRTNIARMQRCADKNGVDLWPHVKTHKMVEIARWQLEAGATGLTCAKLSEAEHLLPSGVRRLFLASGLVDVRLAQRIRELSGRIDQLIVSVTGTAMIDALERVLKAAGLRQVPAMLAVDTGLDREGVRSVEEAIDAARRIDHSTELVLHGFFTHEGFVYGQKNIDVDSVAARVFERLDDVRRAVNPELPIWPGCSVTAWKMAAIKGVEAIRPGAYVFGDLMLAEVARVMPEEAVAARVVATVVDKPRPGLALIDAGSKVFGLDRTPEGIHARAFGGGELEVHRCSEEHGFLRGSCVDSLSVGERIAFIPAHICPVVNLASRVAFCRAGEFERWVDVDARGCVD